MRYEKIIKNKDTKLHKQLKRKLKAQNYTHSLKRYIK